MMFLINKRWRSSIPLMHWAAFATLFSALLSSCAALKAHSDVFNKGALCRVPIEFQKQFQHIWLDTLCSLEPDSLCFPQFPLGYERGWSLFHFFFSWNLWLVPWRWSHWEPGYCSRTAQPDVLPFVSFLKNYCLHWDPPTGLVCRYNYGVRGMDWRRWVSQPCDIPGFKMSTEEVGCSKSIILEHSKYSRFRMSRLSTTFYICPRETAHSPCLIRLNVSLMLNLVCGFAHRNKHARDFFPYSVDRL